MSWQASTWVAEAKRHPELPTNGWAIRKLLLMLLANHAPPCGVVWVSQRTLMEESEISKSTVIRALQDLCEYGYLQRIGRRRDNGSRASDIIVFAPFGDRGSMTVPQDDDLPPQIWGCLCTANVPAFDKVALSNVAPVQPLEQPTPYQSKDRGNYPAAEQLDLMAQSPHAHASEPTHEGSPVPAFDLPYTHDDWTPSYVQFSEVMLAQVEKYGVHWTTPDPASVVLDFWRDLHWQMDTAYVESRRDAIKAALRAYPLRDTTMVLRAIAAALKDVYIYPVDGTGPFNKLETLVAVTAKRDNVGRLGSKVSEDELESFILQARDNRRYFMCWKAEMWDEVTDDWIATNRKRLKKDAIGRYRRYEVWKGLAHAST